MNQTAYERWCKETGHVGEWWEMTEAEGDAYDKWLELQAAKLAAEHARAQREADQERADNDAMFDRADERSRKPGR